MGKIDVSKSLVIDAPKSATAALIFLHGFGGSGIEWKGLVPEPEHVKVILPTASFAPATSKMRFKLRSWFDMVGKKECLNNDDEEGILEAVAAITSIINEQVQMGIASDRIVLAGFSQGGAVALTTGLRIKLKLGGVFVMGSWLPLRNSYPEAFGEYAREIPLCMRHGEQDAKVSASFSRSCAKLLQEHEVQMDFKCHVDVDHSAHPEMLEELETFVKTVLPAQSRRAAE